MKKYILTFTILLLGTLEILAQDVMVTVAPVQQVLPPHALMYVANPGKYFNVTITNVSSQTQYVYLGMDIEQIFPSRVNVLATPQNRQSASPIVVGANRTVQLSMIDLKRAFNHLSSKELRCTADVFSGFGNGSYGLLPEGQFQVHFTAYKWVTPQLSTPVVVSNVSSGKGTFYVSYKAKAPEFLTPVVRSIDKNSITEIDPLNAQFTWKESVLYSFPKQVQYAYKFKVVEVLKDQPIDYAIDHNPVVFQMQNLLSPQCVIPTNFVLNRMDEGKVYAARIIATPKTYNSLDYVMVENSGKSDVRLFKIVSGVEATVVPDDTLADEMLLSSFEFSLEEDDEGEYGLEELGLIVEESSLSALECERIAHIADSMAQVRLQDMIKSLSAMSTLTYPAAKKAGHTQNMKDAQNKIESSAALVTEKYNTAASEYVNAYYVYQRMVKQKSKYKKDYKSDDLKLFYEECARGVYEAKNAALKCKSYSDSIKATEFMANKKLNVITSFK